MARRPKPQKAKGPIDTRLKLADLELCRYIREQMVAQHREVNQQITHMLKLQMKESD